MKLAETLFNAAQGHGVLRDVWRLAKPELLAGHRLQLSVKPATRSNDQNALLHAELSDIACSRDWAGRRWDIEVWKRLLTAAWMRARGEQVMVLPALDGAGVDIVFRRTSDLTTDECSELIDFVKAWKDTAA